MLLQRLSDYAARQLDLPPPMYQRQPIRYIIELDRSGQKRGVPIDTADPAARETKYGTPRLAPHVKRSSGVRAKLLADRGDYVLGIVPADAKPDRVRQQHEEFVELVRACAEETNLPEMRAIVAFLDRLDVEDLGLDEGFDATAHVTFSVEGSLPIDFPQVQAFWASKFGPAEEDQGKDLLPCIVCGELRPALARHPLKIKGIPGGQMAGTDLISANAKAFESYGLANSLIAPTCQSCAERYGNGLNQLLREAETHLRVGSLVYVFWARAATRVPFGPLLANPNLAEVKRLYEAIWRAEQSAVQLDPTAFSVIALGASGGRAVVRDWIDTTVAEAQWRLARYFRRQELVNWDGTEGEPLSVRRLAAATLRRGSKEEIPPAISDALLNLALGGRHDNAGVLLEHAVRRNRAEQSVTRERAALIKMALLAQAGEENMMVQLNPNHPDAAYHCGRLLAMLDAVQQRALGNPNATIIDKFYGTASSAPAAVFGTLLHGVQPHLAKLRKDQPGMHHIFQEDLEEIMGRIASFPSTLTLPRQGLFALGFYHQRAASRLERSARSSAKREGGASGTDAPDDSAE